MTSQMQLQMSCNKKCFPALWHHGCPNAPIDPRHRTAGAADLHRMARRRAGYAKPPRGERDGRGSDGGPVVAPAACLRRTGLSGVGRLYGSRQLGDRHRGWLEVRLHAAFGHPAVQPDGDPSAGARGPPWHRHRPRPGAGLPGDLFTPGELPAVDRLRGRDHRLRSGGGDRHRDRVEAPVPAFP